MTADQLLAEPRRRLTLDEVRQRSTELHLAAARSGISNIRVFGSVARNDADDDSDLDLLVDVAPGRGLFALGTFACDVEDLFGVFTQVVTEAGLKQRIRERVLAEAVAV
jgi:predicted nucleotidyltransferase